MLSEGLVERWSDVSRLKKGGRSIREVIGFVFGAKMEPTQFRLGELYSEAKAQLKASVEGVKVYQVECAGGKIIGRVPEHWNVSESLDNELRTLMWLRNTNPRFQDPRRTKWRAEVAHQGTRNERCLASDLYSITGPEIQAPAFRWRTTTG